MTNVKEQLLTKTTTTIDWSRFYHRLTEDEAERYAIWKSCGRCGDCGEKLPQDYDKDTCPRCGKDLLPF